MATSANLGYPRIGPDGELKRATETYWAGRLSAAELHAVARRLRLQRWEAQREAAIQVVPSNDFSLYDHVLDTPVLVGAVPERYGSVQGEGALGSYFAMARGAQSGGRDVEALLVGSERGALLLEVSLIRSYRPRYNQRLKHGRGYPFLRTDPHAPAPGAALTRTPRDDGAAYFGPFLGAGRDREVLEVTRRLYRVCTGAFERDHARLRADRRQPESDLLDLMTGQSRSAQDRIERTHRGGTRRVRRHACASRVEPRRDASEPPRVRARITVVLASPSCEAP